MQKIGQSIQQGVKETTISATEAKIFERFLAFASQLRCEFCHGVGHAENVCPSFLAFEKLSRDYSLEVAWAYLKSTVLDGPPQRFPARNFDEELFGRRKLPKP